MPSSNVWSNALNAYDIRIRIRPHMVRHTKGSGTHVPGLSESVGTGPPLLFRQPLNRHLKCGRLPARNPSRQTEAAKEKVSAHTLHCSNISRGTNVIAFKSNYKFRIQLQKLDQTSASNLEQNTSKT